ncbi:MAG: hypothetical protein FWG88_04850 [Oscillospiraceae bacterium]|nr:hypothetical protein [Oscillospiraceae bacterium]
MNGKARQMIGISLAIILLLAAGAGVAVAQRQAADKRARDDLSKRIREARETANPHPEIGEAVMVAMGAAHTIVLAEDGTVWASGSNASGQLGDASGYDSSIAVKVIGLSGAVEVAAGEGHSLALLSDGTVWAWGDNSMGQLGTDTISGSMLPVMVPSLSGIIGIASKGGMCIANGEDGSLWVWGSNNYGLLTGSFEPKQMSPATESSLWVSVSDMGMSRPSVNTPSSSGSRSAPSGRGSSADTRTVTGFVWPIAFDMFGLGDDFLSKHEITVELRSHFLVAADPALTTIVDDSLPGPFGSTGGFVIEDVPYGSYVLVIKRAGFLVRAMHIEIADTDPDPVALEPPGGINSGVFMLWYGDCNDDFRVDNEDVMFILQQFGFNALDPNYVAACDLNADCLIDNEDVLMVLEMWNRMVRDYEGAEDVGFLMDNVTFDQPIYTLELPDSGTELLQTQAQLLDEYGVAIPGMQVTYGLTAAYPGVTIDASTGEISASSTAQPGTVTITASCMGFNGYAQLQLSASGFELQIDAVLNKEYTIALSGADISSFNGRTLTVSYDPAQLQLLGAAEQTGNAHTTTGAIAGTDITIESVSPGIIELSFDKSIELGSSWTGAITVLRFKALATCTATVNAR